DHPAQVCHLERLRVEPARRTVEAGQTSLDGERRQPCLATAPPAHFSPTTARTAVHAMSRDQAPSPSSRRGVGAAVGAAHPGGWREPTFPASTGTAIAAD